MVSAHYIYNCLLYAPALLLQIVQYVFISLPFITYLMILDILLFTAKNRTYEQRIL